MNRLLWAVAAIAIATPAAAKPHSPAPPIELVSGKTITGTAKPGEPVDTYYLIGMSGTTARFDVKSAGPVEVTLFDPGGTKILSKSGSGTVTLRAVLPWSDVHTLAIARAKPSVPYTLRTEMSEPTAGEMSFASGMGYKFKDGYKCWITPGVKRLTVLSRGTQEISLLADRMGAHRVDNLEGIRRDISVAYAVEGDDLVISFTPADGKPFTSRTKLDPSRYAWKDGYEFVSYLCDEAKSGTAR